MHFDWPGVGFFINYCLLFEGPESILIELPFYIAGSWIIDKIKHAEGAINCRVKLEKGSSAAPLFCGLAF